MKNIIIFLFYFINNVIGKDQNKVSIHSFPDYDDMTRGLVFGISLYSPDTQIYILTHNKNPRPQWATGKNIHHIKKYSLKGLWAYFTSKNVFYTHGLFSWVKPVKQQNIVNVWHGMPIKKIGRYIDETFPLPNSTYTLSTSPFFDSIIAKAFNLESSNILTTGLPRNDILTQNIKPKAISALNITTENYCLWLPTYRKGTIGYTKLDGKVTSNIFNIENPDFKALNESFKRRNVTAIIKPHPMASNDFSDSELKDFPHIKVIDQQWLNQEHCSLYELLSGASFLITDISSVLIDFLLTNKPIICHFPDRDAYKDSRGLTWNFNPEEYSIPLVDNQTSLCHAIEKQSISNPDLQELKKICHKGYQGFTKQLFEELEILKNETIT